MPGTFVKDAWGARVPGMRMVSMVLRGPDANTGSSRLGRRYLVVVPVVVHMHLQLHRMPISQLTAGGCIFSSLRYGETTGRNLT